MTGEQQAVQRVAEATKRFMDALIVLKAATREANQAAATLMAAQAIERMGRNGE